MTRTDQAQGDARHLPGAEVPVESTRPSLVTYYLSVLRRRRWLIAGCVAGAVALGLIVTLLMTPQYTAVTTLEIQRETQNFTMVKGVEPESSPVDLEFYETQYGLLQARSLADRVAVTMRLQDSEVFFTQSKSKFASRWFEDGRVRPGASTRDQRIREAGDLLLDHLEVAPTRLSRLVQIRYTSPDPTFSRRVVDAWAQNFISLTLERRYEATSYARKFLEGRLAQLRNRIDESERQLVAYASREGIVNLPATTPGQGEGAIQGERSLAADDLATINRELARATADRVAAESRRGTQGGSTTEALENNAISDLRGKRAQLAADYARLMVQFEPDYPPARAVQTQIEQIDRALAREESRVQNTLQGAYRAALEREGALKERVARLKSGVLDLRRRSIQYNIIEREVDTNRQLYDALLQRYKEIGVSGGVGVNNISVVDPAELPEKPSRPRLLVNLALSLIGGVVIGLGLALLREQIDEGLADPAEVPKLLGIPLLGTTPRLDDGDPTGALADRKSALSEAYFSLQTNLSFSTDHGVPSSLAVTSSRPAEGKTTTSYALARALSRSSRRTLLLDADMRSPSIHFLFELGNEHGLSNYLAGHDGLGDLIHATGIENLSVMAAGPPPPSAAELLSSSRFEAMLAELLRDFDHVVIDAPPVMGLADAPLITSKVEGSIFVIEAHGTKKSMARVALERLRATNAQLLGVVLTKFDAGRAHYGYGYDYGYGYGYGQEEKA